MIENRNSDSHDVLSVYDLVSDHQAMTETPNNASELIQIIKERHKLMMGQRPELNPGEFKTKNNKAGDSVFVAPEHLIGTLTQGFEEYLTLARGLPRAIFMQYLISECHPFNDGNGRLSRIMMNCELHSCNQHKIIVPTVHRDSYLNGLRKATRLGKFRVLVKVFYQLQQYAGNIDWDDYADVRELIQQHGWNKLPDDGVGDFNRQLIKFKMDYPFE
ncbi:MAG: Fic family protein [Saccharospirillaceae bacterium]|nr:Fic family protein [Pseudomonadales bacterium]NRB81732.1 Fic family protein [Saccharospirillaceae bacterium]